MDPPGQRNIAQADALYLEGKRPEAREQYRLIAGIPCIAPKPPGPNSASTPALMFFTKLRELLVFPQKNRKPIRQTPNTAAGRLLSG